MGLAVLKTPVRPPQANALCKRLIGTIRRECLHFMIPTTERHLRLILQRWVAHLNQGRTHASLEPGILTCLQSFTSAATQTAIGFRMAIELPRRRSWAACIMNIVSEAA
jgi:transposase InsO family protein